MTRLQVWVRLAGIRKSWMTDMSKVCAVVKQKSIFKQTPICILYCRLMIILPHIIHYINNWTQCYYRIYDHIYECHAKERKLHFKSLNAAIYYLCHVKDNAFTSGSGGAQQARAQPNGRGPVHFNAHTLSFLSFFRSLHSRLKFNQMIIEICPKHATKWLILVPSTHPMICFLMSSLTPPVMSNPEAATGFFVNTIF